MKIARQLRLFPVPQLLAPLSPEELPARPREVDPAVVAEFEALLAPLTAPASPNGDGEELSASDRGAA